MKKLKLLTASAALALSQSALAYLVVIGNSNSKITALSKTAVEQIYLNKSSDYELTPLDLPVNSNAYEVFYQTLFNWSPSQVSNYWNGLIFSGQANPPEKVNSQADALNYVSQTPGTIAYVDNSILQGANVRVLYIVNSPEPVSQPTSEPTRQNKIVINNQPKQHQNSIVINKRKDNNIVISNQPSLQQQAFVKFKQQFSSLNNLLQSTSNKTYFTGAALDKSNPNNVILQTTDAWENEPNKAKQSTLSTITKMWQQALGNGQGTVSAD